MSVNEILHDAGYRFIGQNNIGRLTMHEIKAIIRDWRAKQGKTRAEREMMSIKEKERLLEEMKIKNFEETHGRQSGGN